jgi:hypothetical protein
MTGGGGETDYTSSWPSALILVYPCNMRGFSSVPTKEQRRKNMIIEEAVNKATDGGYHINGFDGTEPYYSGTSSHYSAWTRQDNDSSFVVAVVNFLLIALALFIVKFLGWLM